MPASLAVARRARNEAAENLEQFLDVDKPELVKDIEFSVESAQNSLDYQKEELRQLEKMYKADDLTEETEEIILTRARNRVKSYQHRLDKAITASERSLKLSMPRREKELRRAAEQTELSLEDVQSKLPASQTVVTPLPTRKSTNRFIPSRTST